MNDPKDRASDDTESFERLYATDLDAEPPLDLDEDDDTVVEDFAADYAPPRSQAAWRRLDERRDDKWLREQLSDWDDDTH